MLVAWGSCVGALVLGLFLLRCRWGNLRSGKSSKAVPSSSTHLAVVTEVLEPRADQHSRWLSAGPAWLADFLRAGSVQEVQRFGGPRIKPR